MADIKPKIKDGVNFIKKQIAFLPILLFLPIYLFNPSEKLLLMLFILIVWFFLCFTFPFYIIKWLIEKLEFSQKFTDFISKISIFFMWGFTIFDLLRLLFFKNINWEFPMGIFLIPFFSFLKVSLGILNLTLLYKIYIFYKKIVKDR